MGLLLLLPPPPLPPPMLPPLPHPHQPWFSSCAAPEPLRSACDKT
jgi:hypothetical protein